MAASDRLTGTNAVVEFLLTGDTPSADEVVLSADFTSFSYNRQTDTVDVTAGNEGVRYEVGTIESMDWSLMMFDANISNLSKLKPGNTGLLSIYKEGKTGGLPKLAFNVLITGMSTDVSFDGAIEIDLSGVRLGAMVSDIGTTV